jgi:hypothetical protein
MERMLPMARDWCDRNLRHDGDMDTQEFAVAVYERQGLGRPPAPGGVSLQEMLSSATRGFVVPRPVSPAKPFFLLDPPVLWSQGADLHYRVKAAYSPLRFSAIALPEGLTLNQVTGELVGHFPKAGLFTARVGVSNPIGSAETAIEFRVVDADWTAEFAAPLSCHLGESIEFNYAAFDARGKLDFIDVTDVTAGKVLVRLTPSPDEQEAWQGRYRTAFTEAGMHRVIARTVRFDPMTNAYGYIDREWTIDVRP